jgi:hypothetical protein
MYELNKEYVSNKYTELCNTPSDINEHLPTLYNYATNCESVIELGVRGCISSWALMNGLLNNNSNNNKRSYLLLNDLCECDIREILYHSQYLNNMKVNYIWKNDLELDFSSIDTDSGLVDLVFIDTWHIYGQLKRELDMYSKITKKYIIMHDTTVDEIYGEYLRRGNINMDELRYISLNTNIPENEILCGLGKAVDEFLANNKNWILLEKYTNNNGLTVLKRIEG